MNKKYPKKIFSNWNKIITFAPKEHIDYEEGSVICEGKFREADL